jgi:uncharacterized protein (DUF885 family)
MQRYLFLAAFVLASCGPAPEDGRPERPSPGAMEPPPELVDRAEQDFGEARDAFIEWYLETHPIRATELGVHDYDGRLPALDRAGVQTRIDDLLDWIQELEAIPFDLMTGPDRYDYAILEFALRGELLELEEVRSWVTDPRRYTGVIATGLSSIAEHDYAPASERVEPLQSRMRGSVDLLNAARENLRSPPELWTRLAREEAGALVRYLEEGLPAALEAQAGAPVAGLDPARERLIGALREYGQWLETDLLPRSTGQFQLGRYLLQRKLLYDEHLSLTVDELERLNEQAIASYQARVDEVAESIDPTRSPRAILDSIARVHPSGEELIPAVQDLVESLRDWTRSSEVVTLPESELPVVRETPAHARGAFAYLDAPGPFEEAPLEAHLYITNAGPEWTEAERDTYLTYFNYPALVGVVAHESFPGHYVQAGFERDIESRIRRLFTPRSLVEGWAHYAEGMVLDEGYGDGAPELRLGQLKRALQRHARWYAALHLHAFGTPIEEVVQRFGEIAHLPEPLARHEVMRATHDPTYLYYALGRMQIEELRDDYRAYLEQEDEPFSLRDFHDTFLRLGLPVPLAREVMIPTGRTGPDRGP